MLGCFGSEAFETFRPRILDRHFGQFRRLHFRARCRVPCPRSGNHSLTLGFCIGRVRFLGKGNGNVKIVIRLFRPTDCLASFQVLQVLGFKEREPALQSAGVGISNPEDDPCVWLGEYRAGHFLDPVQLAQLLMGQSEAQPGICGRRRGSPPLTACKNPGIRPRRANKAYAIQPFAPAGPSPTAGTWRR